MAEKRLIDADELLIAFGNALNNANLKIGYGFMESVVNEQPTIDPESLRPTAKWIVVRLMADGAECKCGNCGRHETFTSFDRHTDHVRKEHLDGINKLLDTNFTQEDMEYIYTYLGNGIKHELCMKFVQSGYDLGVIYEGLQEDVKKP